MHVVLFLPIPFRSFRTYQQFKRRSTADAIRFFILPRCGSDCNCFNEIIYASTSYSIGNDNSFIDFSFRWQTSLSTSFAVMKVASETFSAVEVKRERGSRERSFSEIPTRNDCVSRSASRRRGTRMANHRRCMRGIDFYTFPTFLFDFPLNFRSHVSLPPNRLSATWRSRDDYYDTRRVCMCMNG